MIELFISIRYFIERKFQSIVSVLGISIALTAFIVSLSISNGLKDNMLKSILTLSPHIKVDIYLESQNNYLKIMDQIKENDKDILSVSPRIEENVLLRFRGYNKGSFLIGTDIDNLDIKIIDGVKKNSNLTSVLVGEKFLQDNNLLIGDEFTIISTNTKEIRVNVGGVFKTGFYSYDSNLIILPIETLQILKEQGEIATSISVIVNNPNNINNLERITNKINEKNSNDVFAHSWNMDNQSLLSAIKFEKFVLISILSIIVVIASFAITIILNMIVREKINDIGILKAIGYTKTNILKIFIFQGVIIGILGIIFSMIFSPLAILFLKKIFEIYMSNTYYIEKLPISISIIEILILYMVSFILILLSTVIPSIKASKMKPTDSIKYVN